MIEHRSESLRRDRVREAYELHAHGLLRLCVLVTGRQDLAEELVQETFERSARAGAFDDVVDASVGPYLRAAAMNLWKNRMRRLAIERRARPIGPDTTELSYEQRDELWATIRRLPVRQRACVVLRYYEDLSEKETAELLGCSVGTVKSQTSRAIARLREEIRDVDR